MPRLTANAGAMGDGRQKIATGLRAVGQDRERARTGHTLSHEVGLDQDLDRILELEDVSEEAACGPGLLPRGSQSLCGMPAPSKTSRSISGWRGSSASWNGQHFLRVIASADAAWSRRDGFAIATAISKRLFSGRIVCGRKRLTEAG